MDNLNIDFANDSLQPHPARGSAEVAILAGTYSLQKTLSFLLGAISNESASSAHSRFPSGDASPSSTSARVLPNPAHGLTVLKMDPTLLTLALLPFLVPALYLYTVGVVSSTRFPMLRNKRVCLLIAHPDDEAMFFAPAVLALARPELGNHVKILCLSSGDAEGLGETRKAELVKSGLVLGLRKEGDVFVVDNPVYVSPFHVLKAPGGYVCTTD